MCKKLCVQLVIIVSLLSFSHLSALEIDGESKSRLEIISVLNKWPRDFNAKNIQAVCGLFALDLVATYPGTSDRNYDEMCRNLTATLTNRNKQFHYEEPEIEQIIIQGDLAVVRLIWTLKTSEGNKTSVVNEKGLDIFKRQPDGGWKIIISYAYPQGD